MTTQVVTDEQYGKVAKREQELLRRLVKGSVNFQTAMDGLQLLIEGNEVVVVDFEKKIRSLIAGWEQFYKEVFDLEVDFSRLQIPEHQKDFDRLIIVAQGMTLQHLFGKCKELFPFRDRIDKDNNLNMITSERTANNGPYAVWFRDRVDADKELKNFSANKLKEKSIPGITLEERLLYELKYFNETGEHLDVWTGTLCSGSRNLLLGFVPHVDFHGGKVYVGYYDPGAVNGDLRSRAVSE
jgi:hypothetical protein